MMKQLLIFYSVSARLIVFTS